MSVQLGAWHIPTEAILTFLLFAAVFSSGFVLREPSFYEMLMVPAIGFYFLTGLTLNRYILPLFIFWLLINAGGILAISQSRVIDDEPIYIAVSVFLAFTAVFYAALISSNPVKYGNLIAIALVAAATGTALLGILGYFNLIPGGEIFTLYGRAKGAFKDPNVFGPYLIFPTVYLVSCLIQWPMQKSIKIVPVFFILIVGIFLSYSRAAWGLTALSVAGIIGLSFLTELNFSKKSRIILIVFIGALFLFAAMMAALTLDAVTDILDQRLSLKKNYDDTRFTQHAFGFDLAARKPFGIGALEFGKNFVQDPHNTYLKMLLAYGWTGFISYVLLVLYTLFLSVPLLFKTRPWQSLLQVSFIVWLGHIIIGGLIDTDHWRHFYVLNGFVWGFIGAEYLSRRKEAIFVHRQSAKEISTVQNMQITWK